LLVTPPAAADALACRRWPAAEALACSLLVMPAQHSTAQHGTAQQHHKQTFGHRPSCAQVVLRLAPQPCS
jgi:hypothetical protein